MSTPKSLRRIIHTLDNPRGASVSMIQAHILELYEKQNSSHSFEYIYAFTIRSCGYLFKCIDEKDMSRVKDQIMKPLLWLFGLASKVDIDIEDAFIDRYPGICSYCLATPCSCDVTNKSPRNPETTNAEAVGLRQDAGSRFRAEVQKGGGLTLDRCISIIHTIYPNNGVIWRHCGPAYQFAKIQEEMAEIHEAFERYMRLRQELRDGGLNLEDSEELGVLQCDLGAEIADVFAWLISVWGLSYPAISLNMEVLSYFAGGCPVCRGKPCRCGDYSSRPVAFVSREKIAMILDAIKLLASKTQDATHRDAICVLSKDLESAAEPISSQRNRKSAMESVARFVDKAQPVFGSAIDDILVMINEPL